MAAVLQDAVAPVCDMTFRKAEKNFVMVVQRFCWDAAANDADLPKAETGEPPLCVFERVNCALDIEGVEAVQFSGINPNDPAAMLDLLTLSVEDGFLQFVFAGGGKLRLKLADWRVKLHDFGESWPTTHCPRHGVG